MAVPYRGRFMQSQASQPTLADRLSPRARSIMTEGFLDVLGNFQPLNKNSGRVRVKGSLPDGRNLMSRAFGRTGPVQPTGDPRTKKRSFSTDDGRGILTILG